MGRSDLSIDIGFETLGSLSLQSEDYDRHSLG